MEIQKPDMKFEYPSEASSKQASLDFLCPNLHGQDFIAYLCSGNYFTDTAARRGLTVGFAGLAESSAALRERCLTVAQYSFPDNLF